MGVSDICATPRTLPIRRTKLKCLITNQSVFLKKCQLTSQSTLDLPFLVLFHIFVRGSRHQLMCRANVKFPRIEAEQPHSNQSANKTHLLMTYRLTMALMNNNLNQFWWRLNQCSSPVNYGTHLTSSDRETGRPTADTASTLRHIYTTRNQIPNV